MLFERQAPLGQLREAHELAISECGRTVLICGEAGIGKTSLIEEFTRSLPDATSVYWGGCEALFAARPLGPVFDIAEQIGGQLLSMLEADADKHKIHSEFLALIEGGDFDGAVFVIEDIHWADNATMDFLKFVGRRIKRSRCLLLASYRDDEIGPGHLLNHVIGDLPPSSTSRIRLAALSPAAIAEMGHCNSHKAEKILDLTGGNPFFVQELLSSRGMGVPETVTDAILAKASRLTDEARLLLNLASVVPRKCEIAFLESAFPNALELVDECAEHGLLSADREFVTFRHELARLAIEDAVPAGQRCKWHAHMLAEIRAGQPDASARLAHHADLAGDADAVLQHAPIAAQRAARLGAHREAVALYRQALSRAEAIDERQRAELLERLAYELYVTGKIDDAIAARRQCLELWERADDEASVARSLRWLSRLHWFVGNRDAADRYAERALAASTSSGDTGEYAMACSNRAQLYMLSTEIEPAVAWATKAKDLATRNGDMDTLVHALNNLGTALSIRSPEEGLPQLMRSLKLALENDFQEHVARAYTNLSSNMVSAKLYVEAAKFFDAGIDYTSERDLDSWLYYMQGWRARLRFETGDWDKAADDATAVTRNYRGASLVASPAITTLARLRLRRGDPDFESLLDQAFAAIADTHEIQRVAPLVAAQAEQAWLFDTGLKDTESLRNTRAWASRLAQKWLVGELSWWMKKLEIDAETDEDLPLPHHLLLRQGNWSAAAKAWQELGCPYEAALALAEGDEDARLEALDRFTELGAEPAAAKLRRELRSQGVRHLPKQPRQSTRDNPGGLTNRQLAVLLALARGLSDAEIAGRLFISPRTVGHHVSAILAKLGVQSRNEAAALARKMGIDSEN